jgi:hypothetical protein
VRAALFAALVLGSSAVLADEGVPAPLALKVMLKVVSYDPASSQAGGDFVVAVPFAPGGEAGAEAAVREGRALEVQSVNERPLKFVNVAVKDLASTKASAVLITASLPEAARAEVIRLARESKIYSLSLTEQAVHEGALLGVGVSNGKPQPLINVATARALGADFKAALRLARTVQ